MQLRTQTSIYLDGYVAARRWGVEANMIPRGILPEVNEQTPISQRRPLEHFHDEFKNYRSAELDEDATTALEELVVSGFVRCFQSEADAIAYLRGATPVSSKLALVKNAKDGVTKCRLILDCRVSGSNDAATMVERV